MKKTGKRALSLLLSVLMCLTVFALDWSGLISTPFSWDADAYSMSAGSYFVRVTFRITDTGNFEKGFGGWGSDSNDGAGCSIRYVNNNGYGSTTSYQNWSIASQFNNTGTYTLTATISGFPTGFYAVVNDNSALAWDNAIAEYTKIEVGRDASHMHQLWAGNAHMNSTNGKKSVYIFASYTGEGDTSDYVSGCGGHGDEHQNVSTTSKTWTKPVFKSVEIIEGPASLATPEYGNTQNSKSTSFKAIPYDNYDVQWHRNVDYSWTNSSAGYTRSGVTKNNDNTAYEYAQYPTSTLARKTNTVKVTAVSDNITATATRNIYIDSRYLINFDVATNGGDASSKPNYATVVNDTTGTSKSWTIGSQTASKSSPGTWKFVGWNTDPTSHSKSTSVSVNDYKDFTLYALFKKDDIKATYHYYDANGAVKTAVATNTEWNDATTTKFTVPTSVSTPQFTSKGITYTFAGWVRDTATAKAPDFTTATDPTARPIRDEMYHYYAVYTGNVTLTYDVNSIEPYRTSSSSIATQTSQRYLVCNDVIANNALRSDASFTVSGTSPVRTGQDRFLGWRAYRYDHTITDAERDSEDASGLIAPNGTINLEENSTLLAIYLDKRVTVNFRDYTGAVIGEGGTQVRYDHTATPPANPPYSDTEHPDHTDAQSHYVFSYWRYADESEYKATDEFLADQDIYAVYSSHQHVWDKERDQIANCTREAIFDATCTVCGYHIYEVIPAKGHDWYLDGRVEATCLRAGNNGKAVCRACGNTAYDQYFVKTETGYALATAGTEGAFLADGKPTAPAGHRWIQENDADKIFVNEGTCTVAGYKYKKCEVCDAEEITERLGMQPHGYDKGLETVAAVPATCTTDGHNEYSICKDCGAYTAQPVVIKAKGHQLKHFAAVPATCLNEGNIEYWTCSVCGKYFTDAAATAEIAEEDVKLAKVPHTYVETEAEAATCTTPGHTAGIVCSVCGDIPEGSSASETTPALGHVWEREGFAGYETLTVVDTKEATCTEKGYTEYKCSECDATVKVETEMIAHELTHMEAKDASCKEEGNIEAWHCEVCDKYFEDEAGTVEIDASKVFLGKTEHTWEAKEGSEGKEPTCTEDGYTPEMVCSVCGEEKASEVVPATGHVRTDWIEVTPATCTEGGREILVCRACRETLDERTTEPKGHTIEEVAAKDATCVSDGNTAGEVCTVCGYIPEGSTYTVIPATGEHTFVVVSEQAATCAHVGKKYEACSVCGEAKVTETPKLPHGETVDVVPAREATCTAIGTTAGKKCSVCGEILEQPQAIAKIAHTPEAIADVAATCSTKGITGRVKCSVCGKMLNNGTTTDMLQHDWSAWVRTDPTCTEAGSNIRECALCHKYDVRVIPALDHQVVIDQAVPATCTETGLTEGSHCSRCGLVIEAQTSTDMLGHDFVETVVEPTCTKGGYTVHACSRCDEEYTDTETEALDHVWIPDDSRTIAPTCTSKGSDAYVCERCGERKREVTDKLQHFYIASYTEPTCTAYGVITYTCEMCGDTYTEQGEEPLGHDFQNGVCTRCGEPQPEQPDDPGTTPSGNQGQELCEKCGLNHNGRTGLWKQDGFICKIVAFFRNIFKFFSR